MQSHRWSTPVTSIVMLVLLFAGARIEAQVSQPERQALIEFYQATGGDDWLTNDGWLGPEGTECDWHGIQCAMQSTNAPFVLRVLLSGNNLTGRLPDSLAGLDRLISLLLSNNDLEGEIPPDLWGLDRMQDLLLVNNRFTGTVPAAILAMPEGAPSTQVQLSGNLFEGFDRSGLPDAPIGWDIRLILADNRIDELPPVAWRASGAIQILDLSGNRIEGSLTFDDGPWPNLQRMDLSNNSIAELAGLTAESLPDLQILDLGRNHIAELPESLLELEKLSVLELGNNLLSGELPDWFAEMNLATLGLDNNDLSGPVSRAFAALDLENFPKKGPHGDLGLHLHIANNRFSGPLPELDFGKFNSPVQGQSPEFGLDLCFNDIVIPNIEALEVLESRHRAHDLTACLGRQRSNVDASISGSWFSPVRSGEGTTQILLEDGRVLTYWFTFTPSDEQEPSRQQWLLGLTSPGRSWSEFRPLWTTVGGRFGKGLKEGMVLASNTWMRQNRVDADAVHFFYNYRSPGLCITGACFWRILTERFDHTRLTRLAGTTCDNRHELEWVSGSWFDPERSGEGFAVEVLADGRGVVYWFTHAPDDSGDQAWMIGVGEFDGQVLVIDEMFRPMGARFGNEFNPAEVEMVPWGSLKLEFFNGDEGFAVFESLFEEFGAGQFPLVRLARPKLVDCLEE